MKENLKPKNYDIFISHSSQDRKLAIAMCHFLEEKGLRCWMAPRDINAGKDYAEAIIDAIQGSEIMVVVFSQSTNSSRAVRNEVERAFSHQLFIIPFRTIDIIPAQSFEFFLGSTHWLDAIDGSAEDYFEQLYKNCSTLLHGESIRDNSPTNQWNKKNGRTKKVFITWLAATLAVLIILFILFSYLTNLHTNNGNENKKEQAGSAAPGSVKNKKADTNKSTDTQTAHATQQQLIKPRVLQHSSSPSISAGDMSLLNGSTYSQLSTNYSITFSELSNSKLQFSGLMYGYSIHGTLRCSGGMNFKVLTGNVSGNISFIDNKTKAIGDLVVTASGLPCKVDLTKE